MGKLTFEYIKENCVMGGTIFRDDFGSEYTYIMGKDCQIVVQRGGDLQVHSIYEMNKGKWRIKRAEKKAYAYIHKSEIIFDKSVYTCISQNHKRYMRDPDFDIEYK